MKTSDNGRRRRLSLSALALLSVTCGVSGLAMPHAKADDTFQAGKWQQPYGGCEEATLAPTSMAADQCRDHGWTIMRRLAVNPRGVLKGDGLPTCATEDGGRVTPRCIWIGWRDGNGRGLSYWYGIKSPTTPHYLWPGNPVAYSDGMARWVDSSLADALAEGGSPGADTRDWSRCVVIEGPTTYVRCPDSMRPVEAS